MEPKTKILLGVLSAILLVVVLVLCVKYVKPNSKDTYLDNQSNTCNSKENYSKESYEIRENYDSKSNLNVLYTDQNGNLGATVLLPRGLIVMWSGSKDNIPEGWSLCDNSNGTPDLRDRFIVGAGSNNYPSGDKGGNDSVTLTVNQLPSHSHSVNDPGHTHTLVVLNKDRGGYYDGGSWDNFDVTKTTSKDKTGISLGYTGGGESIDIRPKYYALCYIMKL
jgi:hypothetical protein